MELQLGLTLSGSLAKGRFDFDLNQDCETNDRKHRFEPTNRNDNDEKDDDFVIGWPPVKSSRRNRYHRQSYGSCPANYVNVRNGSSGCRCRRSNSLFVKVKMEGIGIARKVDLSLHHSHQTLIPSLIGMFGKRGEDDVGNYNLLYQEEREGDWLPAGDVPWITLANSVRCFKLTKKLRS